MHIAGVVSLSLSVSAAHAEKIVHRDLKPENVWIAAPKHGQPYATLGLIGALGQELAWRGLLYGELIPSGFWRCTIVTGLLWALWHVPLTLQGYGYPQHAVLGTAVMFVYVMLFAPLLTFLRLRAGSVLAPAILHGTADGTVLLTLALVRGGGDLTSGWGSLSCVAVLLVADAILLRFMRPPAAPAPAPAHL